MWIICFYLLLAVVSTAVTWFGSGMLESASEKIAAFYNLPSIVQGAILVAVGSSFPELSTVLVSTLIHDTFDLGVSAIVGSAIFNILVIPAVSGLVSREQLASNRNLVYKEAQFYMISVAALLLTFSFAVIYHPVSGSGPPIQGTLTRSMALIPIMMYGLYLFLQYQDTMDHQPTTDEGDINILLEWGALLLSLGIILAGVEGLVRSAVKFGELFGAFPWLWGITVVAAGTSIPDAFMSVRMARDGKALTCLANVLGSNIFDLLICVPLGILIAGSAVINYSIAAPMMGVLIFSTLMLFTFTRTDMVLSRMESLLLMGLYLLFVSWMFLESYDLLDLIHSIPPASS